MILSAVGGVAVYGAAPPRNFWWLAPAGFALLALSVWGRRARAGFGCGFAFGCAYLVLLLSWLYDFLGRDFGVWPWLGLVILEALFFGLTGAGMAWVSRLRAAPLWMASIVVAAEAVRSRVPYGGFPWGRAAFTQDDGPLLPLAALGGAALITFVVSLIGCAIALAVVRRRPRTWVVAAVVALLPGTVGAAGLTGEDRPSVGASTVAVVQGGAPDVGIDLMGKSETVRRNHLAEADRLVDDVRTGVVRRPDLVIFPESFNRLDASRDDPDLDRISAELRAPLLVGAITWGRGGVPSNRMIRWDPGVGATAEYAKQKLVPFSEFIPQREVAGALTPFVADMPNDMTPGKDPGIFDFDPTRIGVAICYEVAYDHVLTEAVRQGANLLVVPTNNAWFGRTEMTYQQLAMARLRAVEHSRAVVVASTSGVSAIIQPDGTLSRSTGQFTAETVVEQVPLLSETTVASRLGGVPEWGLTVLGLIGLALGFRSRRPGVGVAARKRQRGSGLA